MPRYLIQASYTPDGVKGLIKEGAVHRREFLNGLIERAGGKQVTFDFAFGEHDVYTICEIPDATAAMALSLAVNASGAVKLRTTQLITAEEMEGATKAQVTYRPPGQG